MRHENQPPGTERQLVLAVHPNEMIDDRNWQSTATRRAQKDAFTDLVWETSQGTGSAFLYGRPILAVVPAESFADAPMTVGELRAVKSATANSWSPRDMLVQMLRDHDSGKCVLDDAVIVYLSGDDFGFWNATKKVTTALGLLVSAQIDIADQSKVR